MLIIGEDQEVVNKVRFSLAKLNFSAILLDSKEKDISERTTLIKMSSFILFIEDEENQKNPNAIRDLKILNPRARIFLIQKTITSKLEDIVARGADYFFPTSENGLGEMAQVIKTLR